MRLAAFNTNWIFWRTLSLKLKTESRLFMIYGMKYLLLTNGLNLLEGESGLFDMEIPDYYLGGTCISPPPIYPTIPQGKVVAQ